MKVGQLRLSSVRNRKKKRKKKLNKASEICGAPSKIPIHA